MGKGTRVCKDCLSICYSPQNSGRAADRRWYHDRRLPWVAPDNPYSSLICTPARNTCWLSELPKHQRPFVGGPERPADAQHAIHVPNLPVQGERDWSKNGKA